MKRPAYPRTKPSGVEWLRDVPEHWKLKRLKMAAQLTDKKVEADVDNPVLYIGMENIESWTGRLLPINPDVVPAGTANAFKAGHTLFGKLRPYLAKACNPDFDGLCSTELLVLNGVEFDRDSLRYVLLSDGFIKLVDSSTYGSKMPRASWDFIGNCQLPIASPAEQRAIAAFLDRETGQVDRLVVKKRELIERLKEKRTALISRTVTRGPPPAANLSENLSLKPSGLDSISEVPNEWTISKVWLERVACNIEYQDGNHGELHPKAEDYVDDGIPFVMANHLTAGKVDFESCSYIEPELAASLRIGFAHAEDVLLTHKGTIGRVGQVQASRFPYLMLTPQVTYYRCLRNFSPRYLFWFFQGKLWQDQMYLVSSLGTTRGYVGLLDQRFLNLLRPPVPEQVAIAAYLDKEVAKIDALIGKVELAIERLQEYRTAVITSAVTGKIDVRSEVSA